MSLTPGLRLRVKRLEQSAIDQATPDRAERMRRMREMRHRMTPLERALLDCRHVEIRLAALNDPSAQHDPGVRGMLWRGGRRYLRSLAATDEPDVPTADKQEATFGREYAAWSTQQVDREPVLRHRRALALVEAATPDDLDQARAVLEAYWTQ